MIPVALLASAAVSALSAGASAYNRSKAKKETNALYDYLEDVAKSEQNRTIFDSPEGKALLKISDRNKLEELAAINNRAVAGGATMENQLAARQALNESQDKMNMQLIQYDDRNRRAWKEKELGYRTQRANANANNYLQSAQDWSQWGSQTAGALMSLGSTGLLNGAGEAMAATAVNPADVAGSGANVYNSAVAASQTPPQVNLGGLAPAADVNKLPKGYRV